MLRQFLDQHGADLPTSVSEDAHQRLRSRETASTITEQRAQAAVDGLEELGVDHPAWEVLSSLAAAQQEMRSYSSLYADTQFGDVGKSALRRRLKRLRDADLIETPTRNGDSHARVTPIGHVALEKHPDVTVTTDVSASSGSPSSSAEWSIEHTGQAESHDSSTSSSAVSDPRNSHNSTVLSQRAHEGETARHLMRRVRVVMILSKVLIPLLPLCLHSTFLSQTTMQRQQRPRRGSSRFWSDHCQNQQFIEIIVRVDSATMLIERRSL
ncbi:hypothetical protein [Halovenus salina]|uniref:hypothetical protein n=1 Tax=Halovenus salina TaxID=1510225 RepID=UPI002260A879|nr:hypothetical protein [Halovenus salina]